MLCGILTCMGMVDAGCPCLGCPQSSQFEVSFVNKLGQEPSPCQFFQPLYPFSLVGFKLYLFRSGLFFFLPPFPFQFSL